jgi:hypothetical protein
MTLVRMIHSVGEFAAGTEVEVPDEQADRFIVCGYAQGALSRDYSDDELATLTEGHQEVTV